MCFRPKIAHTFQLVHCNKRSLVATCGTTFPLAHVCTAFKKNRNTLLHTDPAPGLDVSVRICNGVKNKLVICRPFLANMVLDVAIWIRVGPRWWIKKFRMIFWSRCFHVRIRNEKARALTQRALGCVHTNISVSGRMSTSIVPDLSGFVLSVSRFSCWYI